MEDRGNNMNDDSNLFFDKKRNSFDLPINYFSEFENRLGLKISLNEELKSYPMLSSIRKENIYSIPDNYFDNLLQNIKSNIHYTKEIELSFFDMIIKVLFGKQVAFAFGLFFVIGLSIYFFKSPKTNINYSECKTLACLEKNEILNNNQFITNFDDDELIDLVDLQQLNENIDVSADHIDNSNMASDTTEKEHF
jgi:hypothetical protein